MSLFENLVTEGNEKADELAQEGATSDGGNPALITTSVVQLEREIVCVCSIAVCSQLSLFSGKLA